MIRTHKSYIIITYNGFLIKNNSQSETVINFQTHIPNVPFYHHLFDDYNELKPLYERIKQLKLKDVHVLMPDDTLELILDKTVIDNYLLLSKVKKVNISCQFLHLSKYNENYVALSKTVRTLVLHFVKEGKSLAEKFYDKNFDDIEQIKTDIQRLHIECEYGHTPIYINNVNNNMDFFYNLGNLVSAGEIFNNMIKA